MMHKRNAPRLGSHLTRIIPNLLVLAWWALVSSFSEMLSCTKHHIAVRICRWFLNSKSGNRVGYPASILSVFLSWCPRRVVALNYCLFNRRVFRTFGLVEGKLINHQTVSCNWQAKLSFHKSCFSVVFTSSHSKRCNFLQKSNQCWEKSETLQCLTEKSLKTSQNMQRSARTIKKINGCLANRLRGWTWLQSRNRNLQNIQSGHSPQWTFRYLFFGPRITRIASTISTIHNIHSNIHLTFMEYRF